MTMFAKHWLAALAVCAVAGCVEAEPELAVVQSAAGATGTGGGGSEEGVYDIQPQGHWLLGSQLDLAPFTTATHHFYVTNASKDGRPIALSVVNDAALRAGIHVGADPWFDGVIVSDGRIELRITAPKGTPLLARYRLLRRSTGPAFDTDVCGPDILEAIPLAGVFQVDGLHVADAGKISFACGEAVGQKCANWGYPAGPTPGSRWDAHQACTRMARADYGANGQSRTRMETAIKIADAIPGVNDLPMPGMFGDTSVWPPDPTKFFFEAAWWPGTHKAGCLSKVRWQSLPLGGPPGMGLIDPRVDDTAKNCEDMVLDDIVAAGALTFVASAYNDLALQTWHAPTQAGPDYVTTVRGYPAMIESRTWRPFQEYHAYQYDNTIGFLLRRVPGSIVDPATELVEVYVFREIGSDRMVLAAATDPRFSSFGRSPEREGYVFATPRTGSVAFRLFQHENNGDYLSTVDTAVPSGYVWRANIGWIMPAEL
jgi:ADYC domain